MEISFKVEIIRSQIHQWLVTNGLNSFTSSMPEIELQDDKVQFIFDYDDDKILGICYYKLIPISMTGGYNIIKQISICDIILQYPVKGRMDFTHCKMIWEEIKDED